MKKRTYLLTSALLLILVLTFPVSAEAQLYYVTDEAGILTQDENLALESNAEALAQEYGLGVYIITVEDITSYVDAPDMVSAAEQLYLEYELGESEDQSGILLLLSMAERDYALFVFGYGTTVFTEYGQHYLSGQFLDEFGKDSWYAGFESYQRTCGEMAATAQEGNSVDSNDIPGSRIYGVAASVFLGVLIAFAVRMALKRQLKSVAMGTDAEAFITDGGLILTDSTDSFSHTVRTKSYDPPEQSSGKSSGSSGKF